jgi:hypothetical protein
VEPIAKTVQVLAYWATAQQAQLEMTIDISIQHDNLLGNELKNLQVGCLA